MNPYALVLLGHILPPIIFVIQKIAVNSLVFNVFFHIALSLKMAF